MGFRALIVLKGPNVGRNAGEAKPGVRKGGRKVNTREDMEQNRPSVRETLSKVRSIKAEAEIWTPRMLTALVNGVKGGKWFSLMDKVYRPETLKIAWEAVRRNKGSAGVDNVSVERFGARLDNNLVKLSEDLRLDRYEPLPVKRVEIPKGPGQTRPLGIPTVKDRVVQKATQLVIEPIFENLFLDMSYGFRPGRGAGDALKRVDELIQEGYTYVVDADIKGYFDSIPHDKLMDRVKEHIADGRILSLVDSWLRQDIMTEVRRWKPSAGTPQGAVISPILANLYLHSLDIRITSLGFKMVRYADDFVILTKSKSDAGNALMFVRLWMEKNGLTLHPDKVHVGDCRKRGQGFDFLGYRFESGQKTVRKKSLNKMKDRLRELTPRNCGLSLDAMIGSINRAVKGWFNYFKNAKLSDFAPLDRFVRRRLRARLLRMNKSKGFGKSKKCHERWPNSFFADKGLFAMCPAKVMALEDARSLFDGL
jgi:RNA-directed DNA polymerase